MKKKKIFPQYIYRREVSHNSKQTETRQLMHDVLFTCTLNLDIKQKSILY
jgi:hypothetical protein